MHAGLPVLVSDLPELRRVVEGYDIGRIVSRVDPRVIAETLTHMFNDAELAKWKSNALRAAQEVNWQREQEVVRELYESLKLPQLLQ
ncbi:MAG: glycosyltransferase, partial [Flavobacteriales bacterium]